jgi:hypothetical protein
MTIAVVGAGDRLGWGQAMHVIEAVSTAMVLCFLMAAIIGLVSAAP